MSRDVARDPCVRRRPPVIESIISGADAPSPETSRREVNSRGVAAGRTGPVLGGFDDVEVGGWGKDKVRAASQYGMGRSAHFSRRERPCSGTASARGRLHHCSSARSPPEAGGPSRPGSGPPVRAAEENWPRPRRGDKRHTPKNRQRPNRELPGRLGPEYPGGAWAEDRATRGDNPSAKPGAKTGEDGILPPFGITGLAQK